MEEEKGTEFILKQMSEDIRAQRTETKDGIRRVHERIEEVKNEQSVQRVLLNTLNSGFKNHVDPEQPCTKIVDFDKELRKSRRWEIGVLVTIFIGMIPLIMWALKMAEKHFR